MIIVKDNNGNYHQVTDGSAPMEDSNLINYSTEEQYTGKRWIDSKKIYQKTFVGSIPNANTLYTQDFDCSNIDTVINTIKSNLFYVPTSMSEQYTRWYIDRSTNKFTIITQNTQFVGTYNMSIQYTKTTE